MVKGLENIKEIEEELMKVRLEIAEKEKEYERLNKKINNVYLGLPLGIMFTTYGIWVAYCISKGGGENFLSIFGIIVTIGFIYMLFIMFGTESGKRLKNLYKGIELAKKKKKKHLEDRRN